MHIRKFKRPFSAFGLEWLENHRWLGRPGPQCNREKQAFFAARYKSVEGVRCDRKHSEAADQERADQSVLLTGCRLSQSGKRKAKRLALLVIVVNGSAGHSAETQSSIPARDRETWSTTFVQRWCSDYSESCEDPWFDGSQARVTTTPCRPRDLDAGCSPACLQVG